MKSALLIGAIVIGGVGAGFAVERAGLVSPVSETSYLATLDAVPYFECPDEATLGDLHRGDRVFVTGQTAGGVWSEIRAPYDTDSRVWVLSKWLFPDTDPVAAAIVIPLCADDDAPANGPDTATTITTPPPDDAPSTSTSSSSAVATSSSSSSSTSTSTSTSTTTSSTTTSSTLPADGDGPVINFFQSTESELSEAVGECFKPLTAAISAVVFDPSGISSVQLSWSVGTSSETVSVPEIAENIYSVTIGPFPGSTLSGGDAPIALTLTARDAFSNVTSVSSSSLIRLFDCGG